MQAAMDDDVAIVRCAACDCMCALVTARRHLGQAACGPDYRATIEAAARCADTDNAALGAAARALCCALADGHGGVERLGSLAAPHQDACVRVLTA